MGKCIYCGESAGIFNSKHKNCERKYNSGKNDIIESTRSSIVNSDDFSELKKKLAFISKECYIAQDEIENLFFVAYEKAVDHFLDDGILSDAEEEKAAAFIQFFNLPQEALNKSGAQEKLVKAAILRELCEGKIPENRVSLKGNLPFNFQKSETLIWLFQGVDYYEQKSKTHFEGGHHGVSIKVAKGLYYRTGTFRGKPVKTEYMASGGSGILAMTNKHIYFTSAMKTFRTSYDKIISFQPYEDGLGIQKDGFTAKPQVFKNLDGWFVFNVVQNINQL